MLYIIHPSALDTVSKAIATRSLDIFAIKKWLTSLKVYVISFLSTEDKTILNINRPKIKVELYED